MIRGFEESGLSVAGFCQQQGVSTASFYAWRRKLRESVGRDDFAAGRGRTNGAGAGVGSFVPVTLEAVGECFRVRFSERAVVEIPAGDSATLLRVIEQLAAADSGKESLS